MPKYLDKDGLTDYTGKLTAKYKTMFASKADVGTPLVAATAAAMTDTTKIYVYTGSETGYTAGNWYYYNGSAWTSGGVYNSVAVQTDKTLTVENKAADGKATGEMIMVNGTSAPSTRINITTTSDDVELAEMSDVNELKNAIGYFQGGKILYFDYEIIPNSYPAPDGTFPSYNGWDRTGYIEIPNQPIYINNPSNRTQDNEWYDANKQPLSRFAIDVGEPTVLTPPANAKYMVISNWRSQFFGEIYTSQTYYATKEDLTKYDSALDSVIEAQSGTNLFDMSFLDESGYIDEQGNQSSDNFKRTSKYIPIGGQNNGLMYGYLSVNAVTFTVYFYDENKNVITGTDKNWNNVTTKTNTIPQNAKFFRVFTRSDYTANVTLSLTYVDSYIPYEIVYKIKGDIVDFEQLSDDVKSFIGYTENPVYVTRISNAVLTGLYVLDNTYTPYGIDASANSFRLKLKDSNGNVKVNGFDVNYQYYSDKIQYFVDAATSQIVAYYIIHYTGTDYGFDSSSLTFTSAATSLDSNPVIKTYLARKENLVLIGDSLFGYRTHNVLEAILATISNAQVFNCGFGGCRMSWSDSSGSDDYDTYSYVSIADAIAAGNYSGQIANVSLNLAYPYRVASLRKIDWTKPTTIFVNYINNDITGNVSIGDPWSYTASSFDKTTVLGAFNYGTKTILTEYPHIHIVEFTSAWRKLGSSSVPPYAFKNSLNKSPMDYDNAIKENASRQGISVYDYFNNGGQNWYNTDTYQVDNSHYNEKGYAQFAKILNNLYESYKL